MDISPRMKAHIEECVAFMKWVLYACCIGVLVGLVAVAFHFGIDLLLSVISIIF